MSEEKVAEELGNLTLHGNSPRNLKAVKADVHKPDFLLDGTRRRKTFQELEDSIEIDNIAEMEDELPSVASVELAPELASEIKKMSRKILSAESYRLSSKRFTANPCQELVLWQPPSGSVVQILNAVRESVALQEADEEYHRYSTPRLDRIEEEEEEDTQLQDCAMMDDMDISTNPMTSTGRLKSPNAIFSTNKPRRERTRKLFDNAVMDLSMDL